MTLTAGTILGQYEILAPIGAGGMGEVYRARDTRLHRDVAIKVLSAFTNFHPEALQRFEQEARAVAALNHPNIVAVYQMDTHQGIPYLVSELLEGENLEQRLRRGPLPMREVIDYGVQIAHGLAAAHDKGIIHRDLKPDNIFVTREGRCKILDFGLAKIAEQEEPDSDLAPTRILQTRAGRIMGTAGYMSPEQVRGKPADQRSDIFSFSAVLNEMVTGKRTFQKPTSAETMTAILHEEPPSIAEIAPNTPLALQRIVQRGLEKNPERRFQSAADLAFALAALSDPTVMTRPEYQQPHIGKPHSWRKVMAIAAGVLLLAIIVVGYLATRQAPVPKVSNYIQLTHDGQQKSLIGTDGSRLYLELGTSAQADIAEIPVAGGAPRPISNLLPHNMVPLTLSADGSQLLVVDGQGVPPSGPLWSIPIVGGSPRRLGDTAGSDAAWSQDGKMLAYASGSSLSVANADGSESHKLTTTKDLISNPIWSPDGKHLRFDTSEAGGPAGQHIVWEVSADGTNLHQLIANGRNQQDNCCGSWTADGEYFVFQSNGQIWSLPRERGFGHSHQDPTPLTSSPMSLFSPLPSRDGKKLFLVGRTYRGDLTRYDSEVTRVRTISRRYLRRVCGLLEGWTVGRLLVLSRGHDLAKQGGRHRPHTADLPAALRRNAALVSRR